MVKQIKNRIAAFEEMAATSKSTSKILKIEPTTPGFSAVPQMKSSVRAKETSGVVDSGWKPRKNKSILEGEPLQGEMQSAMSRTYEKFKMRRSYKATDGADTELEMEQNGGYGDGPVRMIKVKSKEKSWDGDFREDREDDDRDEQSISPLSFLEYNGDYRHENSGKIEPKFTPIGEGNNAENRHREPFNNIESNVDLSPFHMKEAGNSQVATPGFQAEPRDASYLIYQSIESSFVRPRARDQPVYKGKVEHPSLENTQPEESTNDDVEGVDALDNVLMNYVRGPALDDTDKITANENEEDSPPPPPPPPPRNESANNDYSAPPPPPPRNEITNNDFNTQPPPPPPPPPPLLNEGVNDVPNTGENHSDENENDGQIRDEQVPAIDENIDYAADNSHEDEDVSGKDLEIVDTSEMILNDLSESLNNMASSSSGHIDRGHIDQTPVVKQAQIITSDMIHESISREKLKNKNNISPIEDIAHLQPINDECSDNSSNSDHGHNENPEHEEETTSDDASERESTISDGSSSSDTSLIGAAIEDEDAASAEPYAGFEEGDTPELPDTPQFNEDENQIEFGEEIYYGEAVTLPRDSMHAIYHSNIEENENDDRSGEISPDLSAFEKGYQRELDAINIAQNAMDQESGNRDPTSSLPDAYDDNVGTGEREAQYQVFPTSLESSRNDDAESLGVSVLTDDTYGYEMKYRPMKATEEGEVCSTDMSREEASSIENEDKRSQPQRHGFDNGTVLSSKSNKSTAIYRSAQPLALNPNMKKTRNTMTSMMSTGQSIDDESEWNGKAREDSNPSDTNRKTQVNSVSGSVTSRSTKGSSQCSKKSLNTVEMAGTRDDRRSRKKRSVSSKLRRSLSPFRKSTDKGSSTNTSEHRPQLIHQLSAASSGENTATTDNRKISKKKSFTSRLKSASPFRRRNSKNKIPHHARASPTSERRSLISSEDLSVTSSRIGASPRPGEDKRSSGIMREALGADDESESGMSMSLVNVGHEI